jgi:hypothetical protein
MLRQAMVVTGAVVVLAGCSVGRAVEPGPTVQRGFPVGGFSKIEVAGPYDVTVVTGSQATVQAQGSQGLLDETVVEVKGDTLQIHPRKRRGFSWNAGKAVFQVHAPALSAAAIAGSGTLAVDRVQGSEFTGSIAGSGNLRVGELAVQRFGLEIAGSGSAFARGRAAEARYEIAGSGDIDAGGLQAERLKAEIAGSGGIKARATGTADVSIMGSGDVDVTGGAKCSVSKAGSGNVRCS